MDRFLLDTSSGLWTLKKEYSSRFPMLHVDYFAHLLVDHGQLFIGTDTDPRAKISCQACVMLGLKVSNPIISYEIVHARSHFTLSSYSCVVRST